MKKLLTLLTLTSFSLYAQTFSVSTTQELRAALTSSATNAENNTIIISDGTYKITDDSSGTFNYTSSKENNLTIKGSSSANVILSGDDQNEILDFRSTQATLKLEKLTFTNAKNAYGVFAQSDIEVRDCNFTNNSTHGGLYVYKSAKVINSTFTNNGSISNGGGGFFAVESATVVDSTFINNTATYGGGFRSKFSTVTNSTFTNNHADEVGGGFYTQYSSTVTNSTFIGNSAKVAAGLHASSITTSSLKVTNSQFIDNNSTNYAGAIYAQYIIAKNLLITSNSSGIYTTSGYSKIYNSIFKDNNISDINGTVATIISNLEYNYIDISKVGVIYETNMGNIFDNVNLGFLDEANDDYRLTSSSDLIDAGTVDGYIVLPATDMIGKARVIHNHADIGPYEFSDTTPAISTFTYAGDAKEFSELTFSVNYVLSGARQIDSVLYNYTNDGNWTEVNTHTFYKEGTYDVKVKVTDDSSEYSIKTITITIAPRDYASLSDDQKLKKAIDPKYYESIMAIIQSKEDSSHASGVTLGKNEVILSPNDYDLYSESDLNSSKEYVKNHPSEFDLVKKSDLALTGTKVSSLSSGWHLVSTPFKIEDLSIFKGVTTVWINTNGKWSAYSPDETIKQKIIKKVGVNLLDNIPAGSGIWIKK